MDTKGLVIALRSDKTLLERKNMYRCELLAPAGELEAIMPLIEAGADAIYVGLAGYSSRPQSADLSIEEIELALKMCHDSNVRLHVAINGSISENRIEHLLSTIEKLGLIGVDAMIIADWGVISKVITVLKNSEVHASTLLGAFNSQTMLLLKEMGVKRVVFSTNLYIDEISSMISSVPELTYEIVADGGICFNDNRICELPHENEKENYTVYCRKDYEMRISGNNLHAKPIAAKHISSSELLDMYLELGIYSFKMEGRTVNYRHIIPKVKRLRKALDGCMSNDHNNVSTIHYISRMRR